MSRTHEMGINIKNIVALAAVIGSIASMSANVAPVSASPVVTNLGSCVKQGAQAFEPGVVTALTPLSGNGPLVIHEDGSRQAPAPFGGYMGCAVK